jgi:hypothetical protein
MKQVIRAMLLMAGIVAMTANAALAQATTGSIFGKATDASGGVLPGVTVTVTGTALQQPLSQVTTDSGAYQFPIVPIGTFTVTFELGGFKKAARAGVVVTAGFNAMIDQKMEVGQVSDEITVSAAAPVVDTKKTTLGGTFTSEVMQKIPTARDPWQIIGMAPGVTLSGINVGGSASGQQPTLTSRGTSASVQWNIEGGSITDLSSNSSPSYFNFDSFEQISVVNGGGDVSVQSSGLSINLVSKSGSNKFKGSSVFTFQNDKTQNGNVSEDLFTRGTGGFLSGNPINKIYNLSAEYGGPIVKNRLWWWGAISKQDINVGVLNYFDKDKSAQCATYFEAQRTGALAGIVTYADLQQVQDCLANDKTVINNMQAKFNYQLNPSHKFQFLLSTDDKIRNARGASGTTAKEATNQQYSDKFHGIPQPTGQIQHTWIASDRLVFNTMATYVNGGFFLDYQDNKTCGNSRYNGSKDSADYARDASCLWNQQQLTLRTSGFQSRSLVGTYQTVRHSTEIKTDGTYFMTNVLGGDHSLKFGAGYRKNPVMTFSHYSGGARATYQCPGNSSANCGNSAVVPAGTATGGIVPYQAVLYRDQLRNNSWWSYNGYLQDSFSRGKVRVNAGLRYDWQQSKYLGGCVPANVIRPDLLPAQCEEATSSGIDPNTGQLEEIQPFGNLSPRMSLTYDLKGDGKTALRASGSYYYATRITLANELGALFTVTSLTFGPNAGTGLCTGASCWNDSNRDTIVQANELTGIPTSSNARFDSATGVMRPAGNAVDESAKIARTREFTVGATHELISNLAVGVDYIYRKYDNGTINYTVGYQPGASKFPLSSIYTGPIPYTDSVSGQTGNYYTVCATCVRPSGLGTIAMTNPNYQVYQGVDFTINKRYSQKWQMNMALTVQKRNDYTVTGGYVDPQNLEYSNGLNVGARYIFKLNGSYDLPWGVTSSMNFNMNDGDVRTMIINGPGNVQGGLSSTGAATTISRATIQFQPANTTRYVRVALLDLSLQKTFSFRAGQNRLKVTVDGFNMLNSAEVRSYSSNNLSLTTSSRVSGIVPPRVFRFGVQINF